MGRKRKERKNRGSQGFPPGPVAGLLGAIPAAVLDLHGERAATARRRVADFLATQARLNPGQVVHLVTGSGLGSPDGPVLRGLVGDLLQGALAGLVADHRLDMHRGGWLVRLK